MYHKTGSFLPDEHLRETGDWKQFTLYSRGKHISQAKIPILWLPEQSWEIIHEEGSAQMNHKTSSFLPEEENLRE